MPLKFQRNLYPGINAHLQSEVLAAGRWLGYHNHIITALEASLNRHLPPGYIAVSEESIQMQGLTDDPLAIGVWADGDLGHASPLLWIEIRLPSHNEYIEKRREVLYRGTTFVEIDLIPGISTSLPAIPDYDSPGPEQERHPYHIWFINPVVTRDEPGFFAHAAFTVSDTIPDIRLRLLDRDSVLMKLGEAYDSMFATNPGWGRQTDYAEPPAHAENYVQFRDQVWIAGLMATVRLQSEQGQDFDDPTHSKPTPTVELLTALRQNPAQVAQILHLL